MWKALLPGTGPGRARGKLRRGKLEFPEEGAPGGRRRETHIQQHLVFKKHRHFIRVLFPGCWEVPS